LHEEQERIAPSVAVVLMEVGDDDSIDLLLYSLMQISSACSIIVVKYFTGSLTLSTNGHKKKKKENSYTHMPDK